MSAIFKIDARAYIIADPLFTRFASKSNVRASSSCNSNVVSNSLLVYCDKISSGSVIGSGSGSVIVIGSGSVIVIGSGSVIGSEISIADHGSGVLLLSFVVNKSRNNELLNINTTTKATATKSIHKITKRTISHFFFVLFPLDV
jgi:hypothetical protein